VSPAEASQRTEEAAPGELYRAEIREQPDALRRMLDQESLFAAAAKRLAELRPSVVRLVGHGSSDNAASYGVYAFGLLPGWTALRDSISLSVYYRATLDLARSAVVALSQSGRTPDVVEYVARARQQGALTIAVTNESESELAQAAELLLPLAAGPERAVAATKTYVNQLAALALLAGSIASRGGETRRALARVAELMAGALPELDRAVAKPANAFAFVGRMFVIGRGVEFATAREVALKLTETCRVAAEPLTATSLVHGPIAALDPLFPVWAIASRDETLPAVLEAAARAGEAGAAIVASGNAALEVERAAHALPVPEPPSPLLAPLLSVLPGQLFAAALARAKGLDPDRPAGLSKVTLAR
jgi:glucosamine--fructose-6-phosphate aminotransferase (isomerizing)